MYTQREKGTVKEIMSQYGTIERKVIRTRERNREGLIYAYAKHGRHIERVGGAAVLQPQRRLVHDPEGGEEHHFAVALPASAVVIVDAEVRRALFARQLNHVLLFARSAQGRLWAPHVALELDREIDRVRKVCVVKQQLLAWLEHRLGLGLCAAEADGDVTAEKVSDHERGR